MTMTDQITPEERIARGRARREAAAAKKEKSKITPPTKEELESRSAVAITVFTFAGLFAVFAACSQIVSNLPSGDSDGAHRCRMQAQRAGEMGGNPNFYSTWVVDEKSAKLIFKAPNGRQWETLYFCD
jgi:hypothetical protein